MQLDAAAAPNHVGFVLDQAEAGAYDGTVFHRAVPMGIIQGGDPISKDPAKTALYGTGGLNRLKREPNDRKHVRGAVAAVLQPNKPDSAGAQFFICLTDQPGLDGQFTVFGEVVEGLEVAEQISQTPLDADGRLTTRVVITKATVRDTPPPSAAPFAETPVEELADLARHDQHHARRHRHRVRARRGAGPRAQLPAAGATRCLRRHRVPSRGAEVRRPGRRPVVAAGAADAGAAQGGRAREGRVQRR